MKLNKNLLANISGGIAVVGLIVFPEPSNLTTWQAMEEQARHFIGNPYQIGLALLAGYGYITNLK